MPPTYHVEVPGPGYFQRQVLCRQGCPVGTDAGSYVQAIAEGRHEDAYRIARAPNPFASICGRVCAAPCEARCRRGELDAPVAIRALKRFVCEHHGPESPGFAPERPSENGQGGGRRVAVVGGGPAGLSCAHDLALAGFSVTVFEAQPVPGGMLMLGVPEYRLPREIIRAEIGVIESFGVDIQCGQRLGRDYSLSDLTGRGFEAVFIGIGAHKSRELSIDGVDLDGVFRATDYLLNVNLGYEVNFGDRVAVIGGGSVAFDVARSALRKGDSAANVEDDLRVALDVARSAVRKGVPDVDLYCLEDFSELPASADELEEAQREGIRVHIRMGPSRIRGRDGKVEGIDFHRCTRVFDDAGRFDPRFDEDREIPVDCDTVILAIGQASDLSWVQPGDRLEVTPRGTIKTDPQTLATSREDVFAGGDVAFGPRIIINAVAEGKRAAASICRFLTGQAPKTTTRIRSTRYPAHAMIEGYEKLRHHRPPVIPIDRRIGITEVEQAYAPAAAVEQAQRCLQCHVGPVFNGDTCILCGGCADVCPESCLRLVDVRDLAGDETLEPALIARYGGVPGHGEHGAIIKDETRCIRCGLCAVRCPTGAVTMERVETLPA